MKKIKYVVGIAVAAVMLAGCSNFLDEDNKAGITNEKLYVTSAGYQTLRVNAYNQLRLIYDLAPAVLLGGTDLYQLPRGANSNGIYDYANLNTNDGNALTYYRECYNALQAVNTAEYYLSGAEISQADKDLYAAEYNFLKGFFHFLLLEQFGGIVINDEYTTNPRMNLPRATLEDSYTFIITKLTAALNGPLPQTDKTGKICKDIVNHYLAKAYLTRGWDLGNTADFAQAKTHAGAVITSRGDLKYTFESLWSPKNENNDEVIFAVQYDVSSIASRTTGNDQESHFGVYLGGSERKHKYMSTSYFPSWSVHSWFGKNDARYDATFMLTMWEFYYDYYQGKNDPNVNSISAVYPRAWDKAEEMYQDYLVLTKGETNGEFVDVTMTKDGALIPGAKEFIKKWCPEYAGGIEPINALSTTGTNYLKIYPFIEHSPDPLVNEKYWRTGFASDFCQPVIKKFDLGELAEFNTRQSYRDIVLASLSETMLLYAEACIGRQEYAEAQTYINKVLARPGNAKDGVTTLTCTLPTTSQQDALEAYLKESGKELLGQYCGRWPELRRTKMLKIMYYKYNWDFKTGNFGTDPIGDKLYRPIPQNAIDLNDGISDDEQNPGY
ncbi:MAG: RagB/SusD family nutrient uptake outer membrane protein [Bacteroidales bacterium]|jgi:hypothetical protein|nr:RagB/SusD family nutrient uptake outer membrane protein [Bacteroidales bacterium]